MVYMRHHTKDKGDLALGAVIGHLLENGIQVALPISEHLPFDLIAVSEDGALRRVQVKYRTSSEGRIRCDLRSSWADRNGVHERPFDPASYDALALYCPEPRLFAYVSTADLSRAETLKTSTTIVMRIEPARNGQAKGVRLVADYADPHAMFRS